MAYRYSMTVPYYQVDQQGVVFNMWYLAWCDEAFGAWFGWLADTGVIKGWDDFDVHLVHAEVDWISPARTHDTVEITVSAARVGTTSFDLTFEVLRGEEVLVRATITYVSIDSDSGEKRVVSDGFRAVLAR